MKTKTYLSLTMGPIYETMKYCQKTRELWVGSYFFSYFMRTLIDKLMENNDIKMILPYVDGEKKILSLYKEEGVFHDRFIASSEQNKEDLQEILENKIKETIEQVMSDLDIFDGHCNALKNYLQYHYLIATEDELLEGTGEENIIFAIDVILDSMELQNSFDFKNSTKVCTLDDKDYSPKQKRVGKINPLAKLQYKAKPMKEIVKSEDNEYSFRFKSIPEIAISQLAELLESSNTSDDIYTKALKTLQNKEEKFWMLSSNEDPYGDFYNVIKDHPNYKPNHKYYAVVYADGDKMGSTIRNIYSGSNKDAEIEQFSKNIFEYITHHETDEGKTSLYKEINDFGGMLIYAGGDDLLLFLPIFGTDGKSFFDLLETLSARFRKQMQVDSNGVDVSLSFGVSIQYYKSPMINAIDRAYSLMVDDAKKHNTQEQSGSVAIELTKASGQSHKGVFYVGGDNYKAYEALLTEELTSPKGALPHNIHYALEKSEFLILDIYSNYANEADIRIDALFENHITDGSHSGRAKEALEMLQRYIKLVKPKTKKEFDTLISQLAIIKFLRGDR